ncbi:MAG: hypothetical protein ACK55Z_13560, partial [bacterium]
MEPIFSTNFEIKVKLGLPTVERKSSLVMKRHGGSSGWNGKVYGSTAPPKAMSSLGTLGRRESTFPSP